MHTVHIAYNNLIKLLDCLCQFIDIIIARLQGIYEEITESDAVDDTTMLQAELEYLHQENKKLKKLYYPKKLVYDSELDIYLCPKCKKVFPGTIAKEKEILYCSLCGQRIYTEGQSGEV